MLNVSQFDASLGTLTGVTVTLEGTVSGSANAENFGPLSEAVTLNLAAAITATSSVLAAAITALPVASVSTTLDPFDGGIDFLGASGFSSGPLSASDTVAGTIATPFAGFFGASTIAFDLTSAGSSFGNGGGNIFQQFQSDAAATLTVTYTYEELAPAPVLLPAGAPLLLAALGAFGVARRFGRA